MSTGNLQGAHFVGTPEPKGVPSLATEACPLPSRSKWCTVRIRGLNPFELAVYKGVGWNDGDIVSQSLCSSGTWEISSMSVFGPPGHALDIGGNLGVYSLALASAGWTVTTFEPMPSNVAKIRASLCRNPSLARRITLIELGLSDRPMRCQFISGRDNAGDGNARCGKEADAPIPSVYALRGWFNVARLDDVLSERQVKRIDFVKLDVEGYECNVLRGGRSLFSKYRPRLFQSEVWPNMRNCTPRDYLHIFQAQNYTVARDAACRIPTFLGLGGLQGISDFWMCRRGVS